MTQQEQLIQYLIKSHETLLNRMDRLDQLLTNGTPITTRAKVSKRKKVADELDTMAEREVSKFINSLNNRFR